MKKSVKAQLTTIFIAIMSVICMVGCEKDAIEQNSNEFTLYGEWCYVHDEDAVVAEFSEDGSAEFEGEEYRYTSDSQYINLSSEDGTVKKLRYLPEGTDMYIYIQSVYTRKDGNGGESIVGVWYCEDKGWSFEFTNKGTFMEDGVLTGYYEVDEEAKTIKLMYETALEDTVFYFERTENGLAIEYPWLMRKR